MLQIALFGTPSVIFRFNRCMLVLFLLETCSNPSPIVFKPKNSLVRPVRFPPS